MKIAFIGLGAMGFPIGRALSQRAPGHCLEPHARGRGEATQTHQTTVASTLLDCAGAEVVVTVLSTSGEVDEIVDQLAPKMSRGALWIDATSGHPAACRQTAARLAMYLQQLMTVPNANFSIDFRVHAANRAVISRSCLPPSCPETVAPARSDALQAA